MKAQKVSTMKARIKVGAGVFQDMAYGAWPSCKPKGYPEVTEADPDTVFTVEERYSFQVEGDVHLTAPGFGERGNYGNGGLIVKREDLLPAHDSDSVVCAVMKLVREMEHDAESLTIPGFDGNKQCPSHYPVTLFRVYARKFAAALKEGE